MNRIPFGFRADSVRSRFASIDTRQIHATAREYAAAILCLVEGGYFTAKPKFSTGARLGIGR